MRREIIPIVDEKDRIIRYKIRDERDPKKERIRVSSLWIENSCGQVLLAQRSFRIKNSPGLWGPSAAGTIEKGESYRSNVIKETEEEIGVRGLKITKGKKYMKHHGHEYFVHFFHAKLDKDVKDFKIDKKAVEKLKWFSVDELKKEVGKNPKRFTPSVITFLEEKRL